MDKSQNKKFLNRPKLDGGKTALKNFIKENLKYPKEALENNIQGDVIIIYKVNYNGEIINPKITKGIGYGCDEEALRLVSMLQYEAVNNRGVKITTNNKIKIPFRIKEAKKTSLNISYKETEKSSQNTNNEENTSYNYTISF